MKFSFRRGWLIAFVMRMATSLPSLGGSFRNASFLIHFSILLKVVVTFLVFSVVFAILVTYRSPSTLFHFEGVTEIVDVDVVSPGNSRLRLPFAYDENNEVCVSDITFRPIKNAKIKYSRLHKGPLYILLDGQWRVGGELFGGDGYLSYRVNDPNDDCGFVSNIRLPANGQLTIGSENLSSPDKETLILKSATIDIYARSIDKLVGIIPLNFGPFRANSLYHVDSYSLPALSRVGDAVSFTGGAATWWGIVDVNFEEAALGIGASANAQAISIFSPAPKLIPNKRFSVFGQADYVAQIDVADSADIIALSFGARLIDDPNLQGLYLILVIFVALFRLVQGFISVSIR